MSDCIQGEAVNIARDKPFEDPHRFIETKSFIEMSVQLRIKSFEHILEDKRVDVRQWKAVFIQSKDEIALIEGKMGEHPKGVRFRISLHEQISDDKVNALRIAHRGEVIGDPFEYIFEDFLFLLAEVESSIEIFFYL